MSKASLPKLVEWKELAKAKCQGLCRPLQVNPTHTMYMGDEPLPSPICWGAHSMLGPPRALPSSPLSKGLICPYFFLKPCNKFTKL